MNAVTRARAAYDYEDKRAAEDREAALRTRWNVVLRTWNGYASTEDAKALAEVQVLRQEEGFVLLQSPNVGSGDGDTRVIVKVPDNQLDTFDSHPWSIFLNEEKVVDADNGEGTARQVVANFKALMYAFSIAIERGQEA